MVSQQQIVPAIASILLAFVAIHEALTNMAPALEPLKEECALGTSPFDPRVGFWVFESFVCILTQFTADLVDHYPEGYLCWGLTINCGLPAFVLIGIESGRNKGSILSLPTAWFILFQLIGVSVAFPLLWVPYYALRGNDDNPVSGARARLSLVMGLPYVILTILTYCVLDRSSPAWLTMAGILSGPAVALGALLLMLTPKPSYDDDGMAGRKASALTYAVSGVIALVWWCHFLYVGFSEYGFNLMAIDINASPFVKFMGMDAGVLWIALLIHIASRSSMQQMMEAIIATPFFGPGSAVAMVLASIEVEKISGVSKTKKKL